jgi:protein-S-isoprenylcysteine O-methyltransferase Ste14
MCRLPTETTATGTMIRALDWPPVWTLAHMALAWLLALLWAPLNIEAKVIGWFLIAVSLVLIAWTAIAMKRAGTTIVPGGEPTALVTRGPFRMSRNPIYLGDLGLLAGFSLAVGQPLGVLLVWPLKVVLEKRFVLAEEARLEAHAGEAFREYAARVPRWL